MEKKRILFTGSGGAGTQSVWDLFGKKYCLYFADSNPEMIPPVIPDSKCIKIPEAKKNNFVDVVVELTKEYKIDFLVPGVDEELLLIAESKNKFPKSLKILLPQPDFIKSMSDKYLCNRILDELGLNAPETVLANDSSNFNNFPCIIKPRIGRGARGVMTIQSKKDIESYCSLYFKKHDQIILQEKLVGQEYTIFVFADKDSNLSAVIPVKVIIKRGITISQK